MKSRNYVIAGMVLLTGCESAKTFVAGPPVDVVAELPPVPADWVAAGVVGEAGQGDWVAQFDDAGLAAVVDEALRFNPDLRAAEARVRAAQESARAVFGRSLPSVDYSTQNSYSTVVRSTTLGGGVVVDGRFSQPNYDQRLNFAWELDLWGRVRANNRAARADFQATTADLAGAQLSLAAQAATAWIDLNAALEQEAVARETYESLRRTVELTERRFARGLSAALDVRTARTQLATAESQILVQVRTRNAAARRLEALLGRYPGAEIEAPSTIPALPELKPMGNPTLLLARRPDIAAAEERLKAAGLRAEAARLVLLPALRLNGSVSNSTSIDFVDIFDPQRLSANIAGNFSQSIWNGGALRADRNSALARAEESAATYVGTVLTAWREVEDTLDADNLLAQQEDALTRALEEAEQAERLAERQYRNGLVSIFNLLQSQRTRLNSKASLISLRQSRAVNRIQYHLALGGGLPGADIPPTETAQRDESETRS